MTQKRNCLLLNREIEKSMCNPKSHARICQVCRIDRLIESNKSLARKNLRLAYLAGRRDGLLEGLKGKDGR